MIFFAPMPAVGLLTAQRNLSATISPTSDLANFKSSWAILFRLKLSLLQLWHDHSRTPTSFSASKPAVGLLTAQQNLSATIPPHLT